MKAVVVSHGSIKNLEHAYNVMKTGDIIVCADGGCEYVLNCGLVPDVLVGDLDSIDENILNKIEKTKCKIIRYPREKDYTDTQLAVNYAIEMGADEIIMLGCVGDRLDHSLANIFLLVKLVENGIKPCIVDEKNTIFITNNTIKLSGEKGDLLSLLPVGGDVVGIYTEGLQYKLSGATMSMGDPVGISNVFTCTEASISIGSGYLMVIKSMD